eukprot:CAMPEP_0183722992 /NCGR_PEP_ID=MMETSP0737-20130205/14761_1 /TAXON_ID=385413 /ORGANISM="Thalassiosira miniscula, Strain CCMP1093" /LENGTH=237 /DNA_ID=CAMNT_0025953241 /DNA_START=1 /DNA_END=714 /DNA_ORIENTATION=+
MTLLHDPFSPRRVHYSPDETIALLELLATDHLVDSRASAPAETSLLNDLLAVDLEFDRADIRQHKNVATAPALKDEKDLFLDLLRTDMAVDGARGSTSSEEQHYATSSALHDPYVKEEHAMIRSFIGLYAGSEEQQLRDNAVMMHLLAVDENVDDSKRFHKLVGSKESAIVAELYDVDREVSGAKRRALLVEDLQGLLDVDRLVDGVKQPEQVSGGKRSIFTAKEKYTAKIANAFSG